MTRYRYLVILCAAAAVVATVGSWDRSVWGAPAMLLIPGAAAWMVWRVSLLAAVMLAQTAVCFGGTALLLGRHWPPPLASLVVVWSLAILIGAYVTGRRASPSTGLVWSPPTAMHMVVVGGLVAVSAALLITGQVGYAAQITSGVSTPTGVAGTLSTVATPGLLMILMAAVASGQWIRPAIVLTGVHSVLLTLSGFRGSAALLVFAAAVAGALALPASSPWRRPRRVALVAAFVVAIAVGGFIAGGAVRTAAQVEHGLSTAVRKPTVGAVITRLDMGGYLDRAMVYQDDPAVRDAVAWQTQLSAIIPRAVWPGKPAVAYGTQLSEAAYGLRDSYSSSTISTLGDALVNWGVAGVIVAGLVVGMLLALAERLIKARPGAVTLSLAAAVAMMVLDQAPLILGAVTLLRSMLIMSVLWVSVEMVRRSVRQRMSGRVPVDDPARALST